MELKGAATGGAIFQILRRSTCAQPQIRLLNSLPGISRDEDTMQRICHIQSCKATLLPFQGLGLSASGTTFFISAPMFRDRSGRATDRPGVKDRGRDGRIRPGRS